MKTKRTDRCCPWRLAVCGAAALGVASLANAAEQTNNLPGGQMVITSTNGAAFEGNKAVWVGKVLATDRDMDLMCELLTVNLQTNSGTRQIESIVAETNVVIAQKDSWAFGDVAVYTASNDVVTLYAHSGEVLLDGPEFYLIGPKVIFDRKTGKFHAPGAVTVAGSAGAFGTNSLGIALPGSAPRNRPASPARDSRSP